MHDPTADFIMQTVCALLLSFGLWSNGDAVAPASPQDEDLGQTIERVSAKIQEEKSSRRSDLEVELACLYMKDQKEEEAFTTFLQALDEAPYEAYEHNPEEEEIYSKALKLYLEEVERPPGEVARELEGLLQPIIDEHPSYAFVRFILANAYANEGKWDLFFNNFYTAYKQKRDSFLAFRTLGIMNIKLFEKARTLEAKEDRRRKINSNLERALSLYNEDSTLYKLLIIFSPLPERRHRVCEMIEKIINGNAVIARSQIPFYVHEALEAGDKELARRFLDKAATWYQYSRVIEEMRKVVQDDKISDDG